MSNAQIAVAKDQLDLFAYIDTRAPEAFGETYDPAVDGLRMNNQSRAVWAAMRRGDWITIPKLRETCPGMDTSISARIRMIRTWLEETGRGTVEAERQHGGLWRYSIVRTWPIAGVHYR